MKIQNDKLSKMKQREKKDESVKEKEEGRGERNRILVTFIKYETI